MLMNQGIWYELEGVPPFTLIKKTTNTIKNYEIYGNCFQNGTASTQNVLEIQSVGDYNGLPSNYTRLEYLESDSVHASAYINTNYQPNTNSTMFLDYQYTSAQSRMAAGARNESQNPKRYFTINSGSNGTRMYGAYGSSGNYQVDNMTTDRVTTQIGPDGIFYNGVLKYTPTETDLEEWTLNEKATLFAVMQDTNDVRLFASVKIYECKIWDNSTLVRDFIPCKNDSNVLGMYDKVNGVFYSNSGTGDFIAGPELCKGGYEIPIIAKQGNNIITTYISLDEPLRKVGSDADYIDFANQKVVRKIYETTLDDDISKSTVITTYTRFLHSLTVIPKISGSGSGQKGTVISNKFISTTATYNNVGNYPGRIVPYKTTSGSYVVAFTFLTTTINTVEDAQAELGESFTVAYPRATQIEESIVLPKILTQKGTVILSVGTSIEPSNMYVKFKGKRSANSLREFTYEELENLTFNKLKEMTF